MKFKEIILVSFETQGGNDIHHFVYAFVLEFIAQPYRQILFEEIKSHFVFEGIIAHDILDLPAAGTILHNAIPLICLHKIPYVMSFL